MEISQALQIVLDLAKQNVIDECDEPEEHAQQMAAISTVEGTIVEHVLKTMRSNKNFWGPGRTREDFLRQGRTSARIGNTRSPGNEYWMPQFGTGDSWQAKAFAEGFREECARLGQRVKVKS